MTLGDSLEPGEYLEGPNGRRRDRHRRRHGRDNLLHERAHNPVGRLIAGTLIAAWGLSLLLDNLGLGEMRQYMQRVWPAALVIIGVTMLIHRDANPERYGFWGTVALLAGTWMYLTQHDWFHWSLWSVVWPAAIVLFGVSFIYRGWLRHKSDVP